MAPITTSTYSPMIHAQQLEIQPSKMLDSGDNQGPLMLSTLGSSAAGKFIGIDEEDTGSYHAYFNSASSDSELEEDVSTSPSSTLHSAKLTSFDTLVDDIRAILGPSSGIDSDDVDVTSLMETMRAYDPSLNSHEWEKYALSDPTKGYTRNGVDECNAKANLLILVWNPSRGSMIHDHANAHCVMKILKGSLVETLYDWPEDYKHDEEYSHHTLSVKKDTELRTGDVAYMSDKLGLHRMTNPNPDDVAVSLHLYTPPYAAKFGCHVFDEATGESTLVSMTSLYSDKGVILGGPGCTC